jgi:2-keto-4-pentenoate hydratase/2-oxohepta-3-ene-1,7-dioic acid hydratase in catechol pathway
MKWLRFKHGGQELTGFLEGGLIRAVSGNVYTGEWSESGQVFELPQIEYLPPCLPSKIVAVGLNYRDHAAEMKMDVPLQPIMFLKPPSSLLAHGGSIILPREVRRMDYEAELAVVIGRQAHHVGVEQSLDYVLGYTCNNDVTARDLQKIDQQWTRAKSFNTFCPLGPWIVTDCEVSDLGIELEVNGEIKQRSRTSQLAFGIPELIAFISGVMTLEAGDVILTGTPSGVGKLEPGDSVTVRVENIGELTNSVVAQSF